MTTNASIELIRDTDRCINCNHIVDGSTCDFFNDEPYCQACYSEYIITCDHCNCNHHKSDMRQSNDGNWICDDCFQDYYFSCNDCGNIFLRDDSYNNGNDELICIHCYQDNYCECYDCGTVILIEDSTVYSDNYLCNHCVEHYFRCDNCSDLHHLDHAYNSDGEYLCENCYVETEENDNQLIHKYSYKPEYTYYRDNNDKERCYGIELEIECKDRSINDVAEFIDRHYVFTYMKHDSSISYGFEIVSHPASLGYHQKKLAWDKMLGALRTKGCKSHDTSTCGLHVHASRKHLTTTDIIKIVSFVNLNIDHYQSLARRKSGYAKFKPIKNGQDLKECRYSEDRYEAINITNSKTIEFRIYKGTLRHESFLAAIELTDATIEFCTTANMGIAYIFNNPDKAWDMFISFVKSKPGTYKILLAYMDYIKEREKNRRKNEEID